ncbi:Rhodanese-like protein [Microstroma glucosiphilum]|uniref:Rhodanese-like protein n=1 Tax=Pseudomicrostroma glucosiphilum TaxID=1684307 RepID=A0A316UC14_9BASI|nr:Rhodanese-like protein [Pseudomicrostroma glucosiphilum]PWN22692.1 Rhodanese-like protein [Pseudomicrostroma glucosiphilum]
MPNANPPRDPYKEYLACRIPGARWWDVEEVSTKGEEVRNLPHMMPSPGTFAKAAAQRGISPSSHVVCYDTHGLFSSPRTAFTFLAFGHKNVSVLNGGLPAWLDEGGETQEGKVEEEVVAEEYPEPKLKEGWVRDFEEMVANARMGGRGEVVLDARSRGRFNGTDPEPRAGLSSGHIPSSLSLPFPTLIDTHTSKRTGKPYTTLKDQIALYRTFSSETTDSQGRSSSTQGGSPVLDFEKVRQASSAGTTAVTATCGSGMTAAVIWLALRTLGIQSAIYDESWMGWASREKEGVPIAKQKTVEQAS